MTKRYPLRGALGRGNSCDSRYFQGVALGVFQPTDGVDHLRLHRHKALGDGGPRGHRFGGHVDHLHFALQTVVRKLGHSAWSMRIYTTSFLKNTETRSPAAIFSFSAGTSTKQFAPARAAMSPEPCHFRAFTSGTLPRHSIRAGKKCVSPGRSFSASPNRASTSGKGCASAPFSKSMAGATNN